MRQECLFGLRVSAESSCLFTCSFYRSICLLALCIKRAYVEGAVTDSRDISITIRIFGELSGVWGLGAWFFVTAVLQVNTEPSGGILGKLFRGISAAVSSRLSGMKATDVETTDRQQHAGEEQPREEPGVGANTRATGVELISETTNRKLPGEEIERVGTSGK